jgi:hypothetical protein
VPNGDPLRPGQIEEISRIADRAGQESGLRFSVFVGPFEGESRRYAEMLHAALGIEAATSVLLCVSPRQGRLEIVTGAGSTRRVDDRACALAAMSMRSSFAGGDLAGGLANGLRMLADAAGARVPE